MEVLREAVKACKSGAALVEALEGAGVAGGPIPGLIVDCMNDRRGAAAAAQASAPAANGAAGSTAADAAPGQRASVDSALCIIDGLMFLNPRGKQQLALFKDFLMVKTAKADISVPWGAIQHVAIIDQIPGDTKGRVLLYLHLDSEAKVMNGKTYLTAVVVQTTGAAQLDVAHPQGPPGALLRGPAPVVLCQALGAVPGGPGPASFVSPDPQYFQSANKAAGVRAHVKAREGFLYPLPSALCFLEAPQLFIPHSRIASIELMRAGGTSSTFDLVVHLRGGHTQEFGMLSRSEVAGIEDYIRKCRLVLGAAPDSDDSDVEQGAAEANAAEEDSDDPEDEDFDPSSSSDEEEDGEGQHERPGVSGGTKRKRPEAGDAGGSEEEDAGEAGSEGSEEGSSGEESSEGEDEGSVELVSEDDFSTGQLRSVIASESSGGRRAKRQRGEAVGS